MRPTPILLVLVALGACTSAPEPTDDGAQLRVVATVAPITNLVQNIAGELATVTGLVPEGTNSHTFEPAPSDAALLADADLFIANGLNLEVPSLELARDTLREDAVTVTLADQTITRDEWIFDSSFPEADGDPNPHLWTNPGYAKRYAELITLALAERDPVNATTYRANFDLLAERFDDLARAVRDATATVPAPNRKLLTYHDSFPYFAREFGWQVVGAIQPSDFSEPTAREVAGLITQIREEEIPAIFGSEVFPSPVLETIAAETGAAYVDDLRDDDLPGELGDDAHSLLGLLVFDYTTIVDALGGDAGAFEGIPTANLSLEGSVTYR
jgi:ABC-type Zn uptake system ZnuABC Zn-binding protein ZnuA